MDFSRALAAFRNDSEWGLKVLIGGVLALLGALIIPGLMVTGYQVETLRRAAAGDDSLPAWDDWGGHLVRGGLAVVIQLVYALPALILGCCIAAAATLAGSGEQNEGASALVACLACLTVPLGLFAAFVAPAAVVRYAARNDIAAAFNLGAVLGFIRDNLGPYTLAFLANIGLALGATVLGVFTCGVALPWLAFAAGVIGYHLYGQVAGTAGRRAVAPTF